MSANSFLDRDELREIPVIPVNGSRNADGVFEHRVPPLSQTTKAQNYLLGHDEIHLPEDVIRRLVYGAVEPYGLQGIRVERHRVESGWLAVLTYRAYSLMVSMAVENDRLLNVAHYAADPKAAGGNLALAMPQPHPEHAVLVHAGEFETVLRSVDWAARGVKRVNPQDVGERLVERPLMLVPATFQSTAGEPQYDVTSVDGNGRLAACLSCITVERGWLEDSRQREHVDLLPSHLMKLPLQERRELVRKVAKAAHKRLAQPPVDGDRADILSRNRAAKTLNALTIPVQVIVGYLDDEPERAMQRFPTAVRALLMRMNVGVKPFADGAKNAVTAEEIVAGLHDENLFGAGQIAAAYRDVLVGRGDVTAGMRELGLDPSLPDLRFAAVVQQLTRKEPQFNALVRSKLHQAKLLLAHRNGPVVELGLRSYSASAEQKLFSSARKALETGCLWQDLVDEEWAVENIDTNDAVDDLLARADAGSRQAALLLGTLGMVALVMSGHLLAAAGSAEETAGTTIDRSNVGQIIKKLLEHGAGRSLLADAIKRTRANQPLRWWDDETGRLVSQTDKWKGSTYAAYLRAAARHGFGGKAVSGTPVEKEADALTRFQEDVGSSAGRLLDLIDLREEHGTLDLLPWTEVEATINQLGEMNEDLREISEKKPRGLR
ncbi:hypothetical protein E1181_21395 [Saccharopolyspora terrae]|uniref:Uncharacterized protein n=1 Tax=Saccharopolyspora terrae TaxID=2530384 RepID=A0A4R4VLC6_9PSEU|nr:hypothetical protein [Saccharopolyspora terrae]TDD03134.1 hypothetical protein E1181_21395 [Saccharopolyspora terrae]